MESVMIIIALKIFLVMYIIVAICIFVAALLCGERQQMLDDDGKPLVA
jgi:hypothetical protein